MRKSLFFLAIIVAVLLVPNSTQAHSSPACLTGSELYGYVVDCNNHQANNSFTYSLGPIGSTYTSYVTNGAAKWSPTVSITNGIVNTQGHITTYTDPNTSTVAKFHNYSSNSSGHLTSWQISLNKSIMDSRTSSQNSITLAHELGHAIGLNDLYLDPNSDKLMYGYSTRTATAPTSSDITGAKEATKHITIP